MRDEPLPPFLLPAHIGDGLLRLAPTNRHAVRSYVHDGRCLECTPHPAYALAVDAESVRGPAATWLARRERMPVDEFLARWTREEAVAKLCGHSIVEVIRGCAVPPAEIELRTARLRDLVISVAWRPQRMPPSSSAT